MTDACATQPVEAVTSVEVRAPRPKLSRALRLSLTDTRQDRECPVCGAIKEVGKARCRRCRGYHVTPAEVSVHDRFAADEAATGFVDEHVGGATLAEVGRAIGVTRERVRQIERDALRKLREALFSAGLRADDVREALFSRVQPGEHISSGTWSPETDRYHARVAATRVEREVEFDRLSPAVQAAFDALDDAHAIGLLASRAVDYREYGA